MKKIKWACKRVSISLVDPSPTNYKIASELGLKRFVQSVSEFGRAGSRVVNLGSKGRYVLIDGNSNLDDAKRRGEKYVDISYPSRKLTDKEFVKMCKVFDLAKAGEQDETRIAAETDSTDFYSQYNLPVPARLLDTLGVGSRVGLDKSGDAKKELESKNGLLRSKFIEPPFSVLDSKQGSWQDRKKEWLEWGVKGEIGRGVETFNLKGVKRANGKAWGITNSSLTIVKSRDGEIVTGRKLTTSLPVKRYEDMQSRYSAESQDLNTSVFDPVLCELMYSWFCPKKGKILDPFAGGPSRGLVANRLGYKYFGIELSRKQVIANVAEAKKLLKSDNQPMYYQGDSNVVLDKKWGTKFDLVFTCPPYFDLEVYSKDSGDISNMPYSKFQLAYSDIIKKSCSLLKADRYAVVVISPVRDAKGYYRDLVGDTVKAFATSGLVLYNDAVLLNMIGSASMRADRQFSKARKLVRVHQNVLIFYKP